MSRSSEFDFVIFFLLTLIACLMVAGCSSPPDDAKFWGGVAQKIGK